MSKNSNSIYTGKSMGLANSVWAVMVITSLLSLALLAYKLSGKKECISVDFSIYSLTEHDSNTYRIGETLIFKSYSKSENVSWDFGDKSDYGQGALVKHVYQTTGSFYVTAGTDPGCAKGQWVVIKKAGDDRPPKPDAGFEIVGPDATVAKRKEQFECVDSAGYYEWAISNIPKTTVGKSVILTFPSKGTYTVRVTLDHDRTKRYTKEVLVEDSVEILVPKTPDPPILIPDNHSNGTTPITEATFKAYIEKVVNGDYQANNFDDYLCAKGSTKVILNGDTKHIMNFDAACQELNDKKRRPGFLKKKRKIKIQSVRLNRDPGDDCVTSIEINYD